MIGLLFSNKGHKSTKETQAIPLYDDKKIFIIKKIIIITNNKM